MRAFIREYGRVILVCVFFLIIFLLVPVIGRQLNNSAEGIVDTTKDTYTDESYYYFYVDNKRYRVDLKEDGSMPTWKEWLETQAYNNVDGFVFYPACEGEDGQHYYLAKKVSVSTKENSD